VVIILGAALQFDVLDEVVEFQSRTQRKSALLMEFQNVFSAHYHQRVAIDFLRTEKKRYLWGSGKTKRLFYMNSYSTFDLRLFGVVRGNKMKNYVCVM
jgi:hypothetical protein